MLNHGADPDNIKSGDFCEKYLTMLFKLDLYDGPQALYSHRAQMPQDWHLLYRELSDYFRTVRKSRKKPRNSKRKSSR